MVSLNLLDGTAPLAHERKAGMSRRFMIFAGLGVVAVAVLSLSLEVIFAAFGLGEGTVFFKPDGSVLEVSQDEFDVINREKATAQEFFFGGIKSVSPPSATYSLIKMTNSSQVLVQGWISSSEQAERMFDKIRISDKWNLLYHQVFDSEKSQSGKMKFMYKANFFVVPDEALSFKDAKDLPSIDELDNIITKIQTLSNSLGITFDRKPTIERTREGTSLHEYVYTMNTQSSFSSLESLLSELYVQKVPVVFDKVEVKPTDGIAVTKFSFRLLLS